VDYAPAPFGIALRLSSTLGDPLSHFNRAPAPFSPSAVPEETGLLDVSQEEHRRIRHTRDQSRRIADGRRFGELLIGERIITAAQLETALRLQAASRTYTPLGQVLLFSNKVITRQQLNALLHRHNKRSWLGDPLKTGSITAYNYTMRSHFSRRTPMPVGQALIRLGYVSETTMRDALCTQLHINFFDWIRLDRSGCPPDLDALCGWHPALKCERIV